VNYVARIAALLEAHISFRLGNLVVIADCHALRGDLVLLVDELIAEVAADTLRGHFDS
jgi:hypothetical protein